MRRFLMTTVVLAGAVAAALAGADRRAEASFPGRPGLLIFQEEGTKVANPATGSARKVLDAFVYGPTILPKGRAFAFSLGGRSIFVKSLSSRDPGDLGRRVFRAR